MRKLMFTALATATLIAVAPDAGADTVGLDFTNGTPFNSGVFNNLGWSFTISGAPLTVDGLGLFDVDANGLSSAHEVGLWNANGSLLAQAIVSNSSTAVASTAANLGQWLFADIQALTLEAGSYVIGAFYSDNDRDLVVAAAQGLATAPGLAYVSSLASNGSSLDKPGAYGLVQPGIFGPNLRVATPSNVPEPMSLALVSLALMAAFFAPRGRRG